MNSIKRWTKTFINIIKTEKAQKYLYVFAPIVILFCLGLGLLAYINLIPGVASMFYVGTTLGTLVRAISAFVLVSFSLLCVISFKIRLKYGIMVVFGFLLLINFVMIFITPHQYETLYLSQSYQVGSYFVTSRGLKSILISYLNSVADFAWGFCFLFILPLVFKSHKQLLLVLVAFILIMLLSCFYSFYKDRDLYVLLFTDPTKIGSATGITSFFHTKQTFGVFLCPAFCSSIIMLPMVIKENFSRHSVKIAFIVFTIVSSIILFFVSAASLCRTAIFGNTIMLLAFYIGLIVGSFKNKKYIVGTILSLLLLLVVFGFVMFMNIDSLHSSKITKNLYDFLMKQVFDRIANSSDTRLTIMIAFLRDIPALNLFFGFSKGLYDIYIRSLAPIMRFGLHSGFVIFFAEYGVIMFFITYLFILMIVANNLRNIKKAPVMSISLLGCFLTVMFMNISESEILVFSSSTLVFMFNFLLLVVSDSRYLKDMYVVRLGDNVYATN